MNIHPIMVFRQEPGSLAQSHSLVPALRFPGRGSDKEAGGQAISAMTGMAWRSVAERVRAGARPTRTGCLAQALDSSPPQGGLRRRQPWSENAHHRAAI